MFPRKRDLQQRLSVDADDPVAVIRALTCSEALTCLIAYKKREWARVGFQFNCNVFSRTRLWIDNKFLKEFIHKPTDFLEYFSRECPELDQNDQLTSHLEEIKASRYQLNRRYQIIYHQVEHWSTLDVQIKDGKISFFIADAVNADDHIFFVIASIRRVIPDAEIAILHAYTQHDQINCMIFALDYALCLARISDLHEIVAQDYAPNNSLNPVTPCENYMKYARFFMDILRPEIRKKFENNEKMQPMLQKAVFFHVLCKLFYQCEPSSSWFDNIRYVHTRYPDCFATLFRHMQSYSALAELKVNNPGMFTVSVSTKTPSFLEFYAKKNQDDAEYNAGIVAKAVQFYHELQEFLVQMSDVQYNHILHRHAHSYMVRYDFGTLPAYGKMPPVKKFRAEIIALKPHPTD